MTAAHEPRRAPRGHLSAEELSDAAEARQHGAVDGPEPSQDVAEHLAGCGQCQAEVEAMADLLAALGQLEQPPIPANVAQRIDAALAEAARTSSALAFPAAASDAAATRTAEASTSSRDSGTSGSDSGSSATPGTEDVAGTRPSSAAEDGSAVLPEGDDLVGSRLSSGSSSASRSERRPPSLGADRRRPDARPAGRRSLRRALSWTLASLVVLGGAAGLATTLLSSSGGSASGPSASAARGSAPLPSGNTQPLRNNGAESSNGDVMATLTSWTKSALAASASGPANPSPSEHPHALSTAPNSSVAAAAVAQCLANPATQGRKVLGTSYGVFLGKSAVLVVYALGDGSSSVDSVVYQAPCASTGYLVLAEGTVPK